MMDSSSAAGEEMIEEIIVDMDYEYDACMFFDFSRPESLRESRQAEFWFLSAKSYPPSPFVEATNFNQHQQQQQQLFSLLHINNTTNTNTTNNTTNTNTADDDDAHGGGGGSYQRQFTTTGLTFYHHTPKEDNTKLQKNTPRVSSRISTLMKPTASHLAKLNQQQQQPATARSHTSFLQTSHKNSYNAFAGFENQAPKRQKLDGGQLRKVSDIKQQTTFVHKAPKKNQTMDANSTNANKLKLTIPREPELVTAHRAQRIRSKDISQGEVVSLTTHRFRARPFNRKIFEAPSMSVPKKTTQRVPEFQAFHLKTSERAMRHSSAVLSSSFHDNDSDMGLLKARTNPTEENRRKDFTRQTSVGAPKQDGCEPTHTFKARPLNEKIFSSKGDIGVFRNTKRENTVPKEFNFHTEKKTQQDPPTELFSKLSLLSQANLTIGTQLRRPQPTHLSLQDSKENRFGVSNQEQRMHSVKERPRFYTGQTNYGMSRGLGIR